MRARGAKATDIVMLVVAADDGVMPQTIEAINHMPAPAGVPMIVAINKMDKPDADPNRVRTDLLQHEVIVESMGGDVLEVEVSASRAPTSTSCSKPSCCRRNCSTEGQPGPPCRRRRDRSQLDKGRGPVATVLVQRGTLRVGDILVAGGAWGKRARADQRQGRAMSTRPARPCRSRFSASRNAAGRRPFAVVESEARAREITEYRQRKLREKTVPATGARFARTDDEQLKDSEQAEFPILIKADVQGSVEAIAQALEKLGTDEVAGPRRPFGVGGITESDVRWPNPPEAAIIGVQRACQQAGP
jgi:translation initiation factor IF-2